MTAPAGPAWLDSIDELRPTVLVLGGFLTAPPLYRPFQRRLLAGGAGGVVVAPLWTPDWAAAAAFGLRQVTRRAAVALRTAATVSARQSLGAPVLVVGHSAGGIVARILTAPEPFLGLRLGHAGRIGAIVTLGAPHGAAVEGFVGRRIHHLAIEFCERVVPGPAFAPTTGYLSVGATSVVGDGRGSASQRLAALAYRGVVGAAGPVGPSAGDGLVPAAAAALPGATHVVAAGVGHGVGPGNAWYGSRIGMDAWWPGAVAAWRTALRARVEAGAV